MPAMWWTAVEITGLVALVLVAGVGVFLVLMQLPGTWVMLGATALVAWWQPTVFALWTLIGLVALAVLGEVLEFIGSAGGAAKAGGSKRGTLGAVVGALLGAILGTVLIPIPIVGTILGACLGAAVGSILGDRWAGRTWRRAIETGKGAAWGRLWGTIAKVAVAAVMWATITLAVLWR